MSCDDDLRPTRRTVLLASAAAVGCAMEPSMTVTDRPAPSDERDATGDVITERDAGMDAGTPRDVPVDRAHPTDLPRDVAREDRGPPCGIEVPFVASLTVEEIPNPGAVVDYDLYVVLARDDRGLYAYTAVCTHQRCIVVVDNAGTRCPCHDSTFDPDGAVTQGPATRALPNHPVRICEGRVFVDRTHVVSAGTRVTV
jgi:Rieske Fe-S protein